MTSPSATVGRMIAGGNHSFDLIRRSRVCVINQPTSGLAREVVGIGICSGSQVDKFARFKLAPQAGGKVKAPLIGECYASSECKLADAAMVRKYDMLVLEVVSAHVARTPRYPRTLHYRGDGVFMLSGVNTARYRGRFDRRDPRPEMMAQQRRLRTAAAARRCGLADIASSGIIPRSRLSPWRRRTSA